MITMHRCLPEANIVKLFCRNFWTRRKADFFYGVFWALYDRALAVANLINDLQA